MGHRTFMSRWVILLIAVTITTVVSVLLLFPDAAWVGYTDLEIEFVITDVASGQSVPDARIEIQSDGRLYKENTLQDFSLVTDSDGFARKICRESMCSGRRSSLFRTDTFAVHLPWWQFRIVAEGFKPTPWIDLNVSYYIKQAHKTGPGTSKLVVPISLDSLPGK